MTRQIVNVFIVASLIASALTPINASPEDPGTYSAFEDGRVLKTKELIRALQSDKCPNRWEGIKEALSSWEQAFYLYPEIKRQAASNNGTTSAKLGLIKQFIDDEADAMMYGEDLDQTITHAGSDPRQEPLLNRQNLEDLIKIPSKPLLMRIFAMDRPLKLNTDVKLPQILINGDTETRFVAGYQAIMTESFQNLDEKLRQQVIQSLLMGLKSEYFMSRYFAVRSLETLGNTVPHISCIDPTDAPTK